MENAKQGYSEITRLRVPNTLHNKNLPETADNLKFINITDSTLIQHEMHTTFQKIYQKQDELNTTSDALPNFLNSDNDTEPLAELNRRRLTPDMAHSMEGLLTLDELTHSL